MRLQGGTRVVAIGLALVFAAPVTADETPQIVHVLNRLGYGPRPGDVEQVRRIGLASWIDRQLHPDRIAEPALESRLAALPTLRLGVTDLYRGYEIPREARRAIQQRREMKRAPRQVVEERQQAKVLRAVYAERQLDEVLVDFWMNHFNVYAAKGPEEFLVGAFENDVVRPHAWGRFEDLLRATARSPAMLFYLDNWLSADPEAATRGARRRQPAARRRGLNENYAREVMELHTLGVDGGYTQKDVSDVARTLTGWTIAGLREQNPRFVFNPRLHSAGDKSVLGQTIKAGGIDEGERVLHLLATHPSTARFISYKLARRFVADEPPAPLVARAAETFRRTDGDIRAVVETIVKSPEFLGPTYRAAKVKTPLEFVASAVRESGAEVTSARDLARRIAAMGMPLYLQQPPTGYKDTADAWLSTSGLLARLNLALDLAGGRVRGVRVNGPVSAQVLGAPEFQKR